MASDEVKGIEIQLKGDISPLNQSIRESEGIIRSMQKDLSSLKKALSFDDTHIYALRQSFRDLGTTIEQQKDKIDDLKKKYDIYSDALSRIDNIIDAETAALGKNADVVQEDTKVRDGFQKVLDKLEKDISKETALLIGNEAQYASMRKEIDAAADATSDFATSIDGDMQRAQNTIEEIENRFKSLNQLTKFDTTKIQAFTAQLDLLGQKTDEQQQLLNLYNQKITQVESSLNKTEDTLIQLRNAEGDHGDEIKETEDIYQQLYTTLNKLNSERDTEKINLQATKAEYTELKQKIDDSSDAHKELIEQQNKLALAQDKINESASAVTGKVDAFTVALGNLVANGIERAADKLRDLATQVYEVGTGFEDATTELAAVLELSKYSGEIAELSDYFEELSLNSKYSAEQIANNATVLANAGYNADEIKDSLKAISDLAAGTGEEFTTMANVTVDGLASMGYAASDAQHFVDVLAKSAIVSNTDVTQMGEALSYAGSVAGTFGYTVEDVTIALGAMATQGVKSTSAGTALRSLITRLAANTSDARTEFEALGGAFFDAEGNARPLGDVLNDLRRIISGMNDEQAAAFEYTLAGQRGLTGLSAIINTTTEDWEDLSTAVYDYNGTVAGMANTRMDSLSGDVALLQHSWEDVQRTMYSGVEPALRKVTNSLNKMMQSEAFQGDIEEMADDASEAFEKLAEIIDATDGNIIDIAGDVIKLVATFAGVTTVTKNVINLGNGVAGLVSSMKDVHSVSGFFSAIGSNAGIASLAVAGVATAVVGYIDAAQDATDRMFEQSEAMYGLSDAAEESIGRIDGLITSFDNASDAAKTQTDAIQAEYEGYQMLAEEYDGLIDANGKIKTGYEERANVILTTLAEAMGVETTELQNQINQYGTLSAAIEDTMVKKKAQAILDANQEKYATALQTQAQLQSEYNTLLAEQNIQKQKVAEATEAAKIAEENYNNAVKNGVPNVQDYYLAWQQASSDLGKARGALTELGDKIEETEGQMTESANVVQSTSNLTAALATGDIDQINAALDDYVNNFMYASNTSVDTLRQQRDSYYKLYQDMKTNLENGEAGMTQAMVDEQYSRYLKAEEEYQKGVRQAANYGDKTPAEYAAYMKKRSQDVISAASGMANDAASKLKINTHGAGVDFSQGFANGIYANAKAAAAAARSVAQTAFGSLTHNLMIQSPSRLTMESGEYFSEGFVIGIEKKFAEIRDMAGEAGLIADEALSNAYMNAQSVAPITNNNTTNSTFNPIINVSVYGGSNETDEQFAERIADVINEKTMRLRQVW